MPLPQPFPGLVIHYSYLWRDEHRRGLEEGRKDRPCLIAAVQPADQMRVSVLPLTHRSPAVPSDAIEIPSITKRRLGLDDARSWLVVTEANEFHWPGHDLRAVPGQAAGTFSYGVVPPRLFAHVKDGVLRAISRRGFVTTPR